VAVRFGTDGVRGRANAELTPEVVTAIGRAAARTLGGPTLLVGRDTRRSGPLLVAALSAGVMAEGVDVVDLGVLPTPGVAALSAARRAPAAVVSASHNPFFDNGVKLFAAGGRKLEAAAEAAIEAGSAGAARGGDVAPGEVPAVGTLSGDRSAAVWYHHHLLDALAGRRLDGLRVALDCANGAAAGIAADLLGAAGAEVVACLGIEPDGYNINAACGSTDTRLLQAAVVERGAALGLAFDGDADRVIAVDETGAVVDGDHLLALFATDLRRQGRLAGNTVAVTVMTNLGFHRAMAAEGVAVHVTDVGDRHVLEALDRHGWSLGGEQSGHLVFRDLATTGDGLLCGLLLAELMVREGRGLRDLACRAMQSLPQVLRNVPVPAPGALGEDHPVWDEVASVSSALGEDGRVLLRPSGTERVVRVMVEAASEELATAAADRLAALVARSTR